VKVYLQYHLLHGHKASDEVGDEYSTVKNGNVKIIMWELPFVVPKNVSVSSSYSSIMLHLSNVLLSNYIISRNICLLYSMTVANSFIISNNLI